MFCLPELTLRPTRCNGFFTCWPKILRNRRFFDGKCSQWLEILPLHAGNARSYVIPKGLVTRDPPPIPCSLCYPAREDRRKTSYWGATIFLGALLKLSSLFTKWGEMRVFLKTPKRLNRRDDCETKMPLWSNQQKLSLLFHLDSEHVCASVDVLPS